jgi:NAD(P)-dependent dehydrogenase (short-subunit alcohol dehydrogenase family)
MLERGWYVIGTSLRTSFPESLTNHSSFRGLYVDFSNLAAVSEALKPVMFSHCPDVLVNNVGTFREADFSVDDATWLDVMSQTMQVNLTSAAMLCKWFINAHVAAGTGGAIINIASRAAYRGDQSEYAAYAASKGALVALTKSIARGFGRQGIVAYSVAPGFTNTDMARDALKTLGEAQLTRDSSFDQLTQPQEIANVVAFLASGQATHMTGNTIHLNGGSYMV